MNSIKNSIQMKKVLIFEDLLFPCASQISQSHQLKMEGKK